MRYKGQLWLNLRAMHSYHFPRRAALAAALCCAGAASAQEAGFRPLWELGAVGIGVSQQAYPGSDEQVRRGVVLPYAIYRGPIFRADNDGIGVRPIRTPRFELDIGVAGSFGSNADDIEARRGMPDLGTLIEFGPRIKWNLAGTPETGLWRLDLPLRGVFDLSNDLTNRGIVFQPSVVWQKRGSSGWFYASSISALIADKRLARTFYEVEPRFARANRPAYQAEAGLLAWRLTGTVSRQLTRDWQVFGFARLDTVAGAANRASPLVRQTTGASAGFGVSYTWLRSEAPAVD